MNYKCPLMSRIKFNWLKLKFVAYHSDCISVSCAMFRCTTTKDKEGKDIIDTAWCGLSEKPKEKK